jgi:hypothetical protein
MTAVIAIVGVVQSVSTSCEAMVGNDSEMMSCIYPCSPWAEVGR